MTTSSNLEFKKDNSGKKVTVVRYFDAPVDQVWQAWTESELLDQWWAPKPWKTETNSMQFREGGFWQYAMVGPENERHLCRVDYKTIEPNKSFSGDDYFCDENWKLNKDMPLMHWKCDFTSEGSRTKVTVTITVNPRPTATATPSRTRSTPRARRCATARAPMSAPCNSTARRPACRRPARWS